MALVSIAPLVSRSGVPKSFMKSTTDLSSLCRQRSTVGVVRSKKSLRAITMSVSSDTQRRVGNHHSNVWEDDVIHSLSTSYGAPVYRERAETLIKDIKLLFSSYMEGSSNDDLIKRIEIVDAIECLGIDRHFQPEIKKAMDYVYRQWNERGIGVGSKGSLIKDLNSTALGFRALRLHRYNVSSAVFDNFKDENGQFFCNSNGKEGKTDKRVRSMLSLFRASNISFPGEIVMDEAKTFATEYLNHVLTGQAVTDVDQSLQREVKYALEFPWYCSVPRWEARNYIEIYEQNYSWLKSNINQKILELAKLDFNILQSMHHKEIQLISRWWTESYLPQVAFYRKRHVELYFWILTGIFEPEFSASRISFAKISTIATVLDDLYDTYGTLDEIRIFTEGVRSIFRWDISYVACLPDHIKKIFEFFMKTANELAAEVEKTQGRDMQAYIRKNGWERYLESYHQEAEWMAAGHVPSFDEYFKNGLVSSGMCILNLIPLLLVGQILPEDILEKIYYPSQFHHFLELTIRLKDDLTDFELEKERGEIVSSLECYLRDHPECTWEDALNHINGMLDHSVSELNWQFLKDDNVPLGCKKLTFNLARGLHFLFKYKDGISTTDNEIKDQIFKVLIEPVPL